MTKNRGVREYVVVLDVGYGPFIWQNAVMYEDSAINAYARVKTRYTTVKLCKLTDIIVCMKPILAAMEVTNEATNEQTSGDTND